MRGFLTRLLVVLTVILGTNYVVWRWLDSLNWSAWWIAVPLVIAETYSLIDVGLFGLTVWKLRRRGEPPAPAPGATVDVFVTTYNEPLDMVLETALAAQRIRHPHTTWILDDGARPELRERAAEHGLGYLTRSEDWKDMPRHAKAGNLNNALMVTEGEFLLILDADQIPSPDILDRTLGYFNERRVALVQTPQYFVNVPADDPLGSQAPLFYGPIQQGKDGWNAAFFCGSNAVLRREALMQLGLRGYVRELERSVGQALKASGKVLRKARRSPQAQDPAVARALDSVERATAQARADVAGGASLDEVTYRVRRHVDAAVRRLVEADLSALGADLAEIAELERLTGLAGQAAGNPAVNDAGNRTGNDAGDHTGNDAGDQDGNDAGDQAGNDAARAAGNGPGTAGDARDLPEDIDEIIGLMSARDWSPLAALESVQALLDALSVERTGEAQPIMPLATISVTEDMATAMRLHSMGWRSVYHHEVLALGLAPEDLQTMLTQRLRWAQGTVQVLLRENPLGVTGLKWGQRLMYFATMWSYLSGFAAVVYLAAPVVYLTLGILPVDSLSAEFFIRFIPFMVVNQLLFLVVARGVPTWRGQQYNLALFPTWIKACTTAARNVWFGRPLGFAVTPKERQDGGPAWSLIRPQLTAMVLLAVALVLGAVRLAVGLNEPIGTLVNVVWVAYDLMVLGVLVKAVRYGGYVPEERNTEHAVQR